MARKIFEIIKSGCFIFAIITLLFYTVFYLTRISNLGNMDIKFIWLFFIFSVLLAFANTVLKYKRFSIFIRFLIHFIISLALYFIVVVVCGGFIEKGMSALFAIIAFIIVYIIAAIISGILISKKEAKKSDSKVYNSQFK